MRRRLLWSALVTLGLLGLLEGGARLLPESVNGRLELVQDLDGSHSMVASEQVPGWDIRPPSGTMGTRSFAVNSWRMRGPEHPAQKGEGVERIILVGDSALLGWLLDWEETMGAVLERRREERFPGVDVQVGSCAAPGHSTVQSIAKLEHHCLAFQPDVVIIGNLNSDGTQWTMSDRERFRVPAWAAASRVLRELALYRSARNLLLRQSVRRQRAQAIPQAGSLSSSSTARTRVPPEEYRENLGRLIQMSREAGALPVLLVPPMQARIEGHPPPGGWPPYWDIMREVAAEEEVLLADGDSLFQATGHRERLLQTPVHPNAAGARKLGELLDQTLSADAP